MVHFLVYSTMHVTALKFEKLPKQFDENSSRYVSVGNLVNLSNKVVIDIERKPNRIVLEKSKDLF